MEPAVDQESPADKEAEAEAARIEAEAAFEEDLQEVQAKRVEEMLFGNSGLPLQAPQEPQPYRPGAKTAEWWKEEMASQAEESKSEQPSVRDRRRAQKDGTPTERTVDSAEEGEKEPLVMDTVAVAKALEVAQQLREEAEELAQRRRRARLREVDEDLGESGQRSWVQRIFGCCELEIAK
ncbi:unnamed protein product [Effrenium voratum]|nr:unnamed protein product [Effrenium voratum]